MSGHIYTMNNDGIQLGDNNHSDCPNNHQTVPHHSQSGHGTQPANTIHTQSMNNHHHSHTESENCIVNRDNPNNIDRTPPPSQPQPQQPHIQLQNTSPSSRLVTDDDDKEQLRSEMTTTNSTTVGQETSLIDNLSSPFDGANIETANNPQMTTNLKFDDGSSSNRATTIHHASVISTAICDAARKRDINWNRNEVMCLLDSIKEITSMKRSDGRKRSSREIFEFAAKKMVEKGYPVRGDREKCRIKWKKLKEEYSQARRARTRDGPGARIPAGIVPFYSMLDEMINIDNTNISSSSTIVRRSTLRSPKVHVPAQLSRQISEPRSVQLSRQSQSTEISGPSQPVTPLSVIAGPPGATSQSQDSETERGTPTVRAETTLIVDNSCDEIVNTSPDIHLHHVGHDQEHHDQHQLHLHMQHQHHPYANQTTANTNADLNASSNNPQSNIHITNTHVSSGHTNLLTSELSSQTFDISYRVSNGYRQITIFGDHDVDIKFRGDCVTINKLLFD